MPSRHTRKRIYLAMVVTVALGFLLPPTVNLNHFRARLSQSLSRSLGRQVSIQDVRLRLLPLPGFTFRQLRISDGDEFGAEPILQTSEDDGQSSVATLRVSSLWRGRLEIASISLTQASLNVVRAPDGHWNLERLITRAAEVPSAPTGRKQPEARTRFPYIEVRDSRINFKLGAEKKPFALSESEFALWLAAENRWNVRLKAVPLRTDESLSDTGTIKLSGSFDRASQFSEMPFHLEVSWERPEVNAITRIVRGHDPGWRGAVDLDVEIKGTPADFRGRMNGSVDEFRRYDIARISPFDVRFSCDQRFRAEAAKNNAANQLDFKCKVPLESGTLSAEGELHPLGKSPDISVRFFASQVPLSSFVRALLHAKSTLPDDLTAEGVIDGGWSIARTSGSLVKWKGALTARKAALHSKSLGPALMFPASVVVNFTAPQAVPISSRRKTTMQPETSRAVVEPFILDLGGDAQVSASFDTAGYRLELNGPLEWRRAMQVARMLGLQAPATDLQGSGLLTALYSGEWQHFGPPTVFGKAQIRSATLSLSGLSEPLRVSGGTLTFDAQSVHAEQIHGIFPRSDLAFIGDFNGARQCDRHLMCNVTFDLKTEDLREGALLKLLSPSPGGLSLPFFNSERQLEAKWLLEVPVSGSIAARHLSIHNLQADNMSAQLQLAAGKILVQRWSAEIFGGKHEGEWAFDLSGARPTITGAGSIKEGRAEELDVMLGETLGSGSFDLDYRLAMSGLNANQLASSTTGTGLFAWRNGELRAVHSEGEHSSPLAFSSWTGRFTIDKQRIALQNSKMTSTSGVREVSGEISFNREWNLKFLRANGSGFIATGTVNNPVVASEPAKLAEAR